jgi:hypothetical protein
MILLPFEEMEKLDSFDNILFLWPFVEKIYGR